MFLKKKAVVVLHSVTENLILISIDSIIQSLIHLIIYLKIVYILYISRMFIYVYVYFLSHKAKMINLYFFCVSFSLQYIKTLHFIVHSVFDNVETCIWQ